MQKTYPVTPAQIASFRAQLIAHGFSVGSGNDGDISNHGVTVEYSYDGATTLTLTIVQKGWWPAALVWSSIDEYIAEATK